MMFAVSGAALGLALALLLIPLLPVRPKLSHALGNLNAEVELEANPGGLDRRQRLGQWSERRLGGMPGLGEISQKDLALLGITTTEHYYKKLLTALAMFMLGAVLSLYAALLGISPVLPLFVGVLLAVVGWRLPDAEVKGKAAKARVQFTRAIAVYVEMVAAERKRDAPITAAMERAATVSDGWIFRQIRQELLKARYDNQEPWVALEQLAVRLDVPKLADTARLIGLSGTEGAAVYEALRGMGRNLRVELLAEDQTAANKSTEQLNFTIAGLGIAFLALILAPALIALT